MTNFTAPELGAALNAGLSCADLTPEQGFGICIVDAGGHVLASIRQPHAAISAAHSAESKARTAVYLLADTGGVPPVSPIVPALTAGLPYPVNVFDGGLVIRRDGNAIGAVGVGGSSVPGQDLAVAHAVHLALTARRPAMSSRVSDDLRQDTGGTGGS